MKEINSKDNRQYKFLKSLLQKKHRQEHKIFPVEGEVVLKEIKEEPKYLLCSRTYYEEHRSDNVTVVADNLFKGLCDTKTPQGIIGYFDFVEKSLYTLPGGKYVYLDGLQDPGNVGTIIRTADALSMDGVIFSPDTADIYSPKAVRSTMASLFRVNLYRAGTEDLFKLKERFTLYTTHLKGGRALNEVNFASNSILILGNEAGGVREEILNISDENIFIPMKEGTDSLNVAIAGGILMYNMR